MKIIFVVLAMMCLVSCTKHIYYLKPEIRGQLYNAETKQPIANTAGDLNFLIEKDTKKIKTDASGNFTVPAYSQYYYYFKPNFRALRSPPTLYISFNYYEPEMYDYSKGKVINGVFENPGAKKIRIIDVGKIYLKPDPKFRTPEEKN